MGETADRLLPHHIRVSLQGVKKPKKRIELLHILPVLLEFEEHPFGLGQKVQGFLKKL
jgi:hypothetical protein